MFRNYSFLRTSTGKSVSKSYGWCIFHFFRNLPPLFPIPPNSVGGFPFLYTVLTIHRLLEDGHSACWEVIPCGPFDLHFSTNKLCWASFHVLFFLSFFNSESEIFILKLTSWKSTLWILFWLPPQGYFFFFFFYPGIFLMGKCHLLTVPQPLWWLSVQKVKVTQSCPTLWDPIDSTVHGILQARILEWVTFPFSRGSSQSRDWTQVSRIAGLYHQGSPRILEWTAYPFSSGSSWSRNRTGVSCIAGGFFTNWATREAPSVQKQGF